MERLLLWFSERKLLSFMLTGAYFFAVVLGHKKVSEVFDLLKEKLSFRVYDRAMLSLGLLLMAIVLFFVFNSIRNSKRRPALIGCTVFTGALLVLSYELFIVFSVEGIHYIQYALLALPVFALTLSFGKTVFWVTVLGAIDEGYQYFVLYADNKEVYYDFNDIILNLAGAGIGVLIILTAHGPESGTAFRWKGPAGKWMDPVTLLTGCLFLGGFFLYMTGLLRFYKEADVSTALIVLSRKPAPIDFLTIPAVGKPFHILHPVEGIIMASVLTAGYFLMDKHFSPGAGRPDALCAEARETDSDG